MSYRSRNKNKNTKKYMNEKREKVLTMGFLGFALAAQLFLFEVAYTNASFNGSEYSIPNFLTPSQVVSVSFNNKLNIIAENLRWSVGTSTQVVQGQALAFLGIQPANQLPVSNFAVAKLMTQPTPVTTAVASVNNFPSKPQVLGAYQVNPEYSH